MLGEGRAAEGFVVSDEVGTGTLAIAKVITRSRD